MDLFADLIGAALDPASRAPAATLTATGSGQRWEVDRADYRETPLDLTELQDVIKRGWIQKGDLVRALGAQAWKTVADEPLLATALAFRQKQISARLAQMARKASHPCANHAGKKATHICLECAKAFCRECGTEADSTDPTPFCLDCDGKMAPL